jgi:16S rRNA (cytidine1402-2'-O)-methyltransferase
MVENNLGELFLIASPIGNLSDFSKRAIETLKKVDYCLCEDTRKTKVLLEKYNITLPELISFYQENEEEKIPKVIQLLKKGNLVALISNAGMPLISDPGYRLVGEIIRNGISLTSVPGPSAVITALAISGLPTDKFLFLGFLAKKTSKRKKILSQALDLKKDICSSVVFYESPFRIISTLELLAELNENISVAVCRELTKKFEQILRGKPKDLLLKLKSTKVKGEVTVVVSKKA